VFDREVFCHLTFSLNNCLWRAFFPHFVVKLNDAPVPYVDTVKYLGVFINSRTNCVDPSAAVRILLGVLIIVSSWRDEMLAVFLAKTYC